MEILKLVQPSIVQQRVGYTHSISEWIAHMIAWRTFTTRRLRGDTQLEVDDRTNFLEAFRLE